MRLKETVTKETFKMLLLGNAESGKSTLVKQMKILHMDGFNKHELNNYRYLVYLNIVHAIEAMVNGARFLEINFDARTQEKVQRFSRRVNDERDFCIKVLKLAAQIWNSAPIKLCFAQKHQLQLKLADNVHNFLTNLPRIAAADFMPNNDDILMCRLIDVGGQNTQRKKWIHMFDDVTALLFVAAMSAYDENLTESPTEPFFIIRNFEKQIHIFQNRMMDALHLFKAACKNEYFLNTAIILFLNKKYVFEEKIQQVPLSVCFDGYTGDNNYAKASVFIRDRFIQSHARDDERTIYVHFTNATNTQNVNKVFSAAVHVATQKNVRNTGV